MHVQRYAPSSMDVMKQMRIEATMFRIVDQMTTAGDKGMNAGMTGRPPPPLPHVPRTPECDFLRLDTPISN